MRVAGSSQVSPTRSCSFALMVMALKRCMHKQTLLKNN